MAVLPFRFVPRARTATRAVGVLVIAVFVGLAPAVQAEGSGGVQGLVQKLSAEDFRVRVQAALLLGKTADGRALPPLRSGLSDESAAVRAASAAALASLGDPTALPSLRRAAMDENPAVRRRIQAAIEHLERRARESIAERRSARLLVKIGRVDLAPQGNRAEALGATAQASRAALSKIPGVALLNPTEDPQTAARRHQRPAVVVRPSVRSLSTVQRGSSLVATARVEFLVQRVPELAILSKLSGEAEASSKAQSAVERAALEADALGAAVDSALRASHAAFRSAAGG